MSRKFQDENFLVLGGLSVGFRAVAASLVALYDRWGRPADAAPYRLALSSAGPPP